MALFGLGYKKKIEEIKRLMDEQNFEQAALTADDISIKRLKSAYELNLVGKAYKCNGDFLQARDAFERSYEMRCSRPVIIDIMDCCLEAKDLDGAEKYFDEYHKVAPEDKVTQYKYRYRIEKRKGRERRLLIMILEELKALEYIEEYAYELAKQYHKAGMAEECMRECDDIILWFGFGPTVERAKTLLAYYKGEISLEDIKSAGAKYQAEQERRWREEQQTEAAVAKESELEEPVCAESMQEKTVQEEIVQEEAAQEEVQETVQEEPEWKNCEEEITEPSPSSVEQQEEEFIMPEIDMSGISFEGEAQELQNRPAQKEELQENSREEEELYIPYAENPETSNERLAELLKKKNISIPEILNNFGRVDRIQKQVVKSLELAINDREKAYFVITGESRTGKTTLALSLVRLLFELDIVKYDRTATIDAVQLNQVSIEDYGEELKNCNLIIENAGGMTKESIDGLLRFSKGSKGKTCVILEDTVRDINKFLRAREELNSLFNNRIHLGKYNTDDLLGFAYDYIKKEDYGIDKMAAQVLRDKIDEIVRDYSNDQRLVRTLKLVEVVIARAEKRAGELILSMAAEGKIRQGNYLVIILDDVIG
ncbi:MAG: hypothetical protein J6K15_07685 [Lachnospiraceae bacterium]|nr:hypothetical protein [Lachnospiraceae bacterium]